MGKILFITEKPSVAMQFAEALGVNKERKNGYLEDDRYIISWCYGHLVTMSYPDKYNPELAKWNMDVLPFIPKTFKYEPIKDAADQLKVLTGLLNRKDVEKIMWSGDSAREGEYIARLVRAYGGHNEAAKEYRVWIDSQTKEEILRGIRDAKPLSHYDNLCDSGYARAIEDYLVGINFSRGLSILYGSMLNNANGTNVKGKYKPIAVGRVMSCVLGMIVERERQIRNATIVPFYKLTADLGHDVTLSWKIAEGSKYFGSPQAYNDIGLLSRNLAEDLKNELNGIGTISGIKKEKSSSKKQAPLLFNLAELQATCTKLFKISPNQTLNIAQSLYEKKLTTYPRTDARVLTTAISKEIEKNISGLSKFAAVGTFADEILNNGWHKDLLASKTKYIDDSKVSDHYAIIPTGSYEGFENIKSLSTVERQVYELICRRFLSIYYPAAEYSKIVVYGKAGSELFQTSCTVLVKEGYLAVAGHEEDGEEKKELYDVIDSIPETVPASFGISEGKSQPPKRYTTGSMILAMENAGQLIEDPELREEIVGAGIGTSATRGAVLEKLEKNEYITVNAKTQQITPAKLGEFIYELLKMTIPTILNPAYTANWEKGLRGVEEGTVTKDIYLGKIYQYIASCTQSIKTNNVSGQVKTAIESLKPVYKDIQSCEGQSPAKAEIKCPFCGENLVISSKAKSYFCSGYQNGCKFSVPKEWNGAKITESDLELFAGSMSKSQAEDGRDFYFSKPTRVKNATGKKGPFKAALQITYTAGDQWARINPIFENNKK